MRGAARGRIPAGRLIRAAMLAVIVACLLPMLGACGQAASSQAGSTMQFDNAVSDESASGSVPSSSAGQSTGADVAASSAAGPGSETVAETTATSSTGNSQGTAAECYQLASEHGYDLSSVSYSQLVIVASSGSQATVYCCEKDAAGTFQIVYRYGSAYVGEQGVGQVFEGSMATPEGLFSLPFAFGLDEPPAGTGMTCCQVREGDVWISDEDSPLYNTYQQGYGQAGPSDEQLDTIYPEYQLAIAIGYNNPGFGGSMRDGCVPGAGSAFFLHVSADKPTSGCVAVDLGAMVQILQWIASDSSCGILIF